MSSSRTAIPHSHRAALRHYYQTTNPKPSHSALKTWFAFHFGYEISQSMVSRSLSESFAYLDVPLETCEAVPKFRVRSCQWPWLDLLLSDWVHGVEVRSGRVSNEVLIRKARQIWNEADESQGLPIPKFSPGWVAKFRRRNEMSHRSLPDRRRVLTTSSSSPSDSGSVQTLEEALIVLPPQSKATTKRSVPTYSTSPASESSATTTITFSSDHLLHLIQHNVFRALMSNKSLLRTTAIFLQAPHTTTFGNDSSTRLCGGPSILRPLPDRDVPGSLYPTLLQMTYVHTSWIDMFPFPRFRDNLIKGGTKFVPEQMRRDLFGDIFPDPVAPITGEGDHESVVLPTLPSTPKFNDAPINERDCGNPDDYTAGRRCLIIWGDPWNIESWEVTPGFLRSWRWALEGCEDLIRASNRWRALRNEELMDLPVMCGS